MKKENINTTEINSKKKSSFTETFFTIFISIFVVVLINKYIFFSIKVPTKSMNPTIKVGDKINVFKIHNKATLKRGDIVVFYSKELNDTLIKRLIGLPGEKVIVAPDGSVYINDTKINEPYVSSLSVKPREFQVPANCYLFLGDNRGDSYDSRYWTSPYISYEDIQGKAKFIYYPFNRLGNLK